MRILAICLAKGKSSSGYTLLEAMVVISLIGLLAGLVLPRLSTLYDGVKWSGEKNEVLRQVTQLGYIAYTRNRNLLLTRYPVPQGMEPVPLDLPQGWEIAADKPVRYNAKGVCFGGVIHMKYKERTLTVVLEPPLGIPVVQ